MNYKKIITSVSTVAFVAALVVGGTGAFFSDTETSEGNTFTAGAIDLKIDSVSHYNGMVCTLVGDGYVWIPEANVTLDPSNQPVAGEEMDQAVEWDAFNTANPAQYPQAGVECTGTWPLDDIGEGQLTVGTFFDFDDIKPGDEGENTISIHIDSNDAWMCVDLANVGGADPVDTQTEPEIAFPDLTAGNTLADSELDENLHFFAWLDDGDNVYEENEVPFGGPVAASTLENQTWALADSSTGNGPVAGGETQYIGLYWCAGDISVVGNTLSCDGETMGNDAQTDSWFADLKFTVEQSRNNEEFLCTPTVQPVVSTLTLAKAVLPPEAALDSAFTLSANGPTPISGVEGAGAITNAVVTAGVYSLSEVGGPGGELSRVWQCSGNATPEIDNADGTATVTVGAGENVVCGITNNYPVAPTSPGQGG